MIVAVFDLVETLFSLENAKEAFRRLLKPEDFFELWKVRAAETSMAATLAGNYFTFRECADASLRALLAEVEIVQLNLDPILGSLEELSPMGDAEECLRLLRREDWEVKVVALTNKSRNEAYALINRAGFTDYFSDIFSADDIRQAKPGRDSYRMVLDNLNIDPSEAWMISAHGWDILGAFGAGLNTIWVNRMNKRWPFPIHRPGDEVHSLMEVPELLLRAVRAGA